MMIYSRIACSIISLSFMILNLFFMTLNLFSMILNLFFLFEKLFNDFKLLILIFLQLIKPIIKVYSHLFRLIFINGPDLSFNFFTCVLHHLLDLS